MQLDRASRREQITRRMVLSSAATMAVAPALAEECRVGPPAHEKGPLVFMDYDQVELDAAYDQSFYAPLAGQIWKRLAAASEAARDRLGQPLSRPYGPTAFEQLDIYRAKPPNAPIFIFIRGVAWLYQNAESFGGDRDRLYIGDHSSGGHLCGIALVTDWAKEFGLPADAVKGGLCMSGMFDLKAVRLSKRSSYLKFTDEIEQAMSSQRHVDLLRASIVVTYGTNETPEFQRQSRDFAAAVKAAGKPAGRVEAVSFNHIEMVESLGNPYGPNGRAALSLMKLASA